MHQSPSFSIQWIGLQLACSFFPRTNMFVEASIRSLRTMISSETWCTTKNAWIKGSIIEREKRNWCHHLTFEMNGTLGMPAFTCLTQARRRGTQAGPVLKADCTDEIHFDSKEMEMFGNRKWTFSVRGWRNTRHALESSFPIWSRWTVGRSSVHYRVRIMFSCPSTLKRSKTTGSSSDLDWNQWRRYIDVIIFKSLRCPH